MLTLLFLFYVVPLTICITCILVATRNESFAKAIDMKDNSDLSFGLGMAIAPFINIAFSGVLLKILIEPILKKSGFYKHRYYKD
jgi:hypothetical protein